MRRGWSDLTKGRIGMWWSAFVAITSFVLLSGLGFSAQANMYRWVDENGRTIISNTVPPSQVHLGYEVLDADTAQVIRRVEPTKTEEELAAEREAARQEEARREEQARQQQRDQMLLQLYSDEEALVRARDIRLGDIESKLAALRRALEREQALYNELKVEVAAAGSEASAKIVSEMESIAKSIEAYRSAIQQTEQDYE
ncbi:MAG TPA: DUF4124 domain-containing protein, partial [Halothiobacillus sp.]|nr:DUF4124 domain-containing protein [Halothiobacillus sp.]